MSGPSPKTLAKYERDIRAADLYAYYKKLGITLFIKRTNGMPDMRDQMNHYYYTKMIGKEKQTKNSRLLYESSHGSSRREEKCGTCPICYDPIQNGKVELGCNHTFCVDCFTKFYLKDNKCPMCRYEFIDKKFSLMDDEHVSSLVGSALTMRIWSHGDQSINYSEIMNHSLNHMNFMNQTETKNALTDATERLLGMVSTHIRDFYENQMFM